jgi:hypothetical protein
MGSISADAGPNGLFIIRTGPCDGLAVPLSVLSFRGRSNFVEAICRCRQNLAVFRSNGGPPVSAFARRARKATEREREFEP